MGCQLHKRYQGHYVVPRQLHSFQMDTKRIPVEQFETKANEAFEYYNELKPSVVILGDDNALNTCCQNSIKSRFR